MPIWYYVSFFFSFWFILLFLLFHIFSLTTCTWRLLWYYTPDLVLWNSSNHKQQKKKRWKYFEWSQANTQAHMIPIDTCCLAFYLSCTAVLKTVLGWGRWMNVLKRKTRRKPTSQRPTTVTVCAENWFEQHFYTRFFITRFLFSTHRPAWFSLPLFFLVLTRSRLILEFTWIEFGCKIASFRSLLSYFSCEKFTNLRSEKQAKKNNSSVVSRVQRRRHLVIGREKAWEFAEKICRRKEIRPTLTWGLSVTWWMAKSADSQNSWRKLQSGTRQLWKFESISR